jgi:hypothetical protein
MSNEQLSFNPTEFNPDELPEHFSALIFGKRRSGKGVFVNDLIPKLMKKHQWTEAHLFSPTCLLPAQKYTDWQFVPERHRYDTFSEGKLMQIVEGQKIKALAWGERTRDASEEEKERDEQPRMLIILDDLLAPRVKGADGIFKSKAMSDLFVSGRHVYITVVCLLQSIAASVTPICRKNSDLIAYFRSPNWSDQDTLVRDYLMLNARRPHEVKALVHQLTLKKHSCLCINVTALQWAEVYEDFLSQSTRHKPAIYKGIPIGESKKRRLIQDLWGVKGGKVKARTKIY